MTPWHRSDPASSIEHSADTLWNDPAPDGFAIQHRSEHARNYVIVPNPPRKPSSIETDQLLRALDHLPSRHVSKPGLNPSIRYFLSLDVTTKSYRPGHGHGPGPSPLRKTQKEKQRNPFGRSIRDSTGARYVTLPHNVCTSARTYSYRHIFLSVAYSIKNYTGKILPYREHADGEIKCVINSYY